MSEPYAFGIEEEYFLADAVTGGSPPERVTDAFHAAAADTIEAAEHELLKGQVEFACRPVGEPDAARTALHEARRGLAEVAAKHGLALFAAGSHPLGSFERQDTTDKERYRKLEDQFGIIAHRSMCCAMHVHVEVPDGEDRVHVMNRLLPFLPVLLALSASSPYWEGENGGLACTRLAVFSEWPRMGLPELFSGEADFNRFVDALVEAGMMENASYLWWLIRPSNKYPTIEMRVCDACTRVDEAVAIASLFRCLVRACVRRPAIHADIGPMEKAITAENIWQAQRHGVRARFVDATTRSATTAGEALEAALAIAREEADALGCAEWIERTPAIAVGGSSADRQRAAFAAARAAGAGPRDAMAAVVAALAAETVA